MSESIEPIEAVQEQQSVQSHSSSHPAFNPDTRKIEEWQETLQPKIQQIKTVATSVDTVTFQFAGAQFGAEFDIGWFGRHWLGFACRDVRHAY